MNFDELRNDLKQDLDNKSELQHLLYRRGYLITNRDNIDLSCYPFYNNWKKYNINDNVFAYIHKEQKFYIRTNDKTTAILIGHAYNPFTMQIDENEILDDCINCYEQSKTSFFKKVSELTGIHVIGLFSKDESVYVQDCTAMKACYYGKKGDDFYITSHCGLINDISALTVCKFSEKLINSHAYRHWGSEYLPGDITMFEELRRLGPNLYLSLEKGDFSINRFYPLTSHPEYDENNIETINYIADLIKTNVKLCAEKWSKPAISLSGGMDSRTTFAAANGSYDKFKFYSFYCKDQEIDDANAAHAICSSVGVNHDFYPISNNNEDYPNFELYKKIISHSSAYVSIPRDHEIRKYIFLSKLSDFEVELKSWASEIGRAYWERRYGFRLPEKLSARDFSIFQTRFLGTPGLMRENDKCYKSFLERSKFVHPMFNYEDTDMFYWEYRFGSNGTNVTMGQDIFNFEVTMPMNNRKLMDMFLWYPHDFRKNDMIHKATIIRNEPKFKNIDNEVHNGYFAGKRIMLEKIYYKYRTMFYKEK